MFCFKGEKIQIDIFGSSHSAEIGVKMRGFPKERIDMDKLEEFLSRRMSSTDFTTGRKEVDEPIFTSLKDNTITADEVTAVIKNKDIKPSDYSGLYGKPRPSHADYAAYLKDGRLDFTGGGEFSGRMTAPFAVAGGIAKQFLENRKIFVNAYLYSVGKVRGKSYKDGEISLAELTKKRDFPSLSMAGEMIEEIRSAKHRGDSVGGVVECVVSGMKAGYGGGMFDGLESGISYLLFAIPGVKGVEFGKGFDLSGLCGSEANDGLRVKDGKIYTESNNSGGINGGISNGMDITLGVAFRPAPSISIPQHTVDLVSMQNTDISVSGRHDACIAVRAVPVVESAVSLALLDKIC